MLILYSILYLFLIFGNILETNVSVFSYWDEAAALIILLIGIISFLKKTRISIKNLKKWGLLLLLITLGLIGNLIHSGYQDNTSVIVRDIIAISKFFIILFVCQNLNGNQRKQQRIIHNTVLINKIIIFITIFCAFIGYFLNTSFYTGEIRIVKCFQFVFSHPTFYVSSYVVIMAMLIADSIEKNKYFIFLNCLLIFMAQRTKSMLVIVLVVTIVILGEKKCALLYDKVVGLRKTKKHSNRRIYFCIAIIAIIAWLLVKDKVMLYLSWGLSAARPALYIVGVQIMIKFFPFGSGFGTFASSLSGRYYSNIYEEFHISQVSGLRPDSYNYIGDVFWPYIYGQFGVFGLFIYMKLIIECIIFQIRCNITFSQKMATLLLWVYALMASTAEAFFTNSSGVQIALILGLYIGFENQEKRK